MVLKFSCKWNVLRVLRKVILEVVDGFTQGAVFEVGFYKLIKFWRMLMYKCYIHKGSFLFIIIIDKKDYMM
jgi:hypothetical protein